MTIRMKVFAVFGIMLIFSGMAVAYTNWRLFDLKPMLAKSNIHATTTSDTLLPLLLTVKNMEVDIIQIQQWLTDISATRALDGLDDGFDKAKEYAGRFKTHMDEAEHLARQLGQADILTGLHPIMAAFPPYYEMGQRMARAYVADGPGTGNKFMEDFDGTAERINDATRHLVTLTEEKMRTEIHTLKDLGSHVLTTLEQLIVVMIASLCVGAGVVGGGGASLYRVLTRAFADLGADVETVMAEKTGELRMNVSRKDELGPVAKALTLFRTSLAHMKQVESERTAEKERAAAVHRDAMHGLAADFEGKVKSVVDRVVTVSVQISQTAAHVGSMLDSSAGKTMIVAEASERTSENITIVAEAAGQLSQSINDIGRQVGDSSKLANTAVGQA